MRRGLPVSCGIPLENLVNERADRPAAPAAPGQRVHRWRGGIAFSGTSSICMSDVSTSCRLRTQTSSVSPFQAFIEAGRRRPCSLRKRACADHANGSFGRLLHDIERVMHMAGKHCRDIAPSQFAQRTIAMLGQRSSRSDFAQRVVHGNQRSRFIAGSASSAERQRSSASRLTQPLRPVQARLHADRSLEWNDRQRAEIKFLLDLLLHPAKTLVRCEKALQQIEIGHVMVAHFHRHRRRERIDPLRRRRECRGVGRASVRSPVIATASGRCSAISCLTQSSARLFSSPK